MKALIGILIIGATALALAGGAAAADPFTGTWQAGGTTLNAVSAGGRYEFRHTAPSTISSNGCKVFAGDVSFTLKPAGGDTYEAVDTIYSYDSSLVNTGHGERGDNCTRAPGEAKQLRVVVSGGKLDIYCAGGSTSVCITYARVGATTTPGGGTKPVGGAALLKALPGTWTVSTEGSKPVGGRTILIAKAGPVYRVTAGGSWAGAGCTIAPGKLLWTWKDVGGGKFARTGRPSSAACTGAGAAGVQVLKVQGGTTLIASCPNDTRRCDVYTKGVDGG